MAGRPVSARGGLTGLHYGLIAFAVVSVASLGMFILQLTKNKALESTAQIANQKIGQYGSPPSYYADEASSRKTTVFAAMADDQRKLATLVTGVPDDVAAGILAKADRLLSDISTRRPGTINPGDTLLTAVERLSALHAEEQSRADALAATAGQLQAEKAALTEQLKVTRTTFDGQVAALNDQLKQAEEDKVSSTQQKDTQLRETQATLDNREAQLQKSKREESTRIREKDIEIGRLETQVTDLQKKIQAIKPESFDPTAILTSADGRIVRAIPGSDVVYINLGAADRIKPGMGFEVFSPARESSEGVRGKASLEVVTVMEETAECRVTRRTPAQPIIEGDIAVNIAYERGRKPKFVVRGDFDLNYDGVIDFNGVEEASSIIRQWGGQVVDDLDESVDFVVIGLPPTAPTYEKGEAVSDVVREQAQQKELQRSAYRALVERAQKMFIPVITQNQFLFLTGYAGDTTIVRR